MMLIVGKETDTGGYGWDVGGHVDALYGTDYFALQSRGVAREWPPVVR